MASVDRQEVSKLVVHFHKKIANFNEYETVSHVKKQSLKSRRLYYILGGNDERVTQEFRRQIGLKIIMATLKLIEKSGEKLI